MISPRKLNVGFVLERDMLKESCAPEVVDNLGDSNILNEVSLMVPVLVTKWH